MRKICILLCAVLLLVTLAGPARATDPQITPDEQYSRDAHQLYLQCIQSANVSSFRGFCGLMVSYQLWKLGINENLQIYDGNKQYDAYKDMKVTTGHHAVKAYDAKEFSLEEALNAISENGSKTVHNILVGFQWTNTEAGAIYGHACVINTIDKGLVYFTESFDHAMGHMEGQPIVCTIPEFVKFFEDWTKFEGVIHFGEKQYANSCTGFPVDTYLQLRFASVLRSEPCLVGENDCYTLRTLSAGEVLQATAVYENEDGDLFYCVKDGDAVGYVSANAVFRFQAEKAPVENGWFVQDGTWYCYENGAPCTGWVTRIGVRYYLKEDGSVTTGKARVDDLSRHFSATGALCQGWLVLPQGTYYLDDEGIPVMGFREIDGVSYYFDEDGLVDKTTEESVE